VLDMPALERRGVRTTAGTGAYPTGTMMPWWHVTMKVALSIFALLSGPTLHKSSHALRASWQVAIKATQP
jgi:hypothetical protein